MARRLYDLHGIVLAVEAADDGLAGYLDPILAPLAARGDSVPGWTISAAVADAMPALPAAIPRIWEGMLPEGLHAASANVLGRPVLIADNQFGIVHDIAPARTRVLATAEGRASVGRTAAFWLLDQILGTCDRYLLHGACLVRRSPLAALAIFAPSGTGKTTTALALARAGLALAGDDVMVLENASDGPYLWAVPRRVNVHRRTAEMLPWISPLLQPWTRDEQSVAIDTLRAELDMAGPLRAPVLGAIVLQPPNGAEHRITPMAKTAALSVIVSDNVHRAPTGVLADGQATFAALARLIAPVPVVSLSVGPDPASLSLEAVLSAFER